MKKRRVVIVRQRSKWTVNKWQLGWKLAMTRIDSVPSVVERQPVFQECLAVLDGAFADGDKARFELGLIALMDCCNEAVNTGVCESWWNEPA